VPKAEASWGLGLEAFNDFVKRLVTGFNAAGLDYVFTGALAASFYGVPRTTLDVDVLVKVATSDDKIKLVSALRQANVQADEKRVEAALQSRYGIATFRDRRSSFSVDIILSNKRKRLEKRAGSILGLPTFFQAPEDLILAKLRMIKATVPRERAQKDEDDVRAILKFTKVDVEAVKRQARKSCTLSIFESLKG